MRVLVTGGAGYIGSHAARHLVECGHEVVVYDNLSTGHQWAMAANECVIGDISDRAKLRLAMRGIDAVMHFAAYSSVAESTAHPKKYFENNVQSGLSLLAEAVEANLRYFVFSSTCAVYGLASKIPLHEDTPRIPISPYGATKLAFEHALEAYGLAYGLPFVTLRYFNAAGADEKGDIGEVHTPEIHLIPRALNAAAGAKAKIDIYGSDYPTPDGTCVRDYIHVSDLAKAHGLALDYLESGGRTATFNLGTGTGYSVLEVLSMVEQVTGQTITKNFCERRPGDAPILVADSESAKRTLRWSPSRSLHDMVATAWQFEQFQRSRVLSESQRLLKARRLPDLQ